MAPHSIYLHIPFCQHRCSYCDFNTYAGLEELIPAYTDALIEEIRIISGGKEYSIPVKTIFFGGGTPSLLPEKSVARILHALGVAFQFEDQLEITIEANPGTLSLEYLKSLKKLGINRMSLGMQSAHAGELNFLERNHDFGDVVEAIKWARQAGFENLSLDLIFGLPGQPIDLWRDTLNLALGLRPEHFSLYALTVESGTPLGEWTDRGLSPIPDPDIAADMYELACDSLAEAGYVQYEISNWAISKSLGHNQSTQHSTHNTPEYACKHNLQYWRNQPYIGLGAGAHGFVDGYRTQNLLSPRAYIQSFSDKQMPERPYPHTPATTLANKIDQDTEMRETMMMGLRLTVEGVSDDRFQERFGISIREAFEGEIEELAAWGLIEWAGETIRLTSKGKLLGNQVFMRFV
ncbi:MAG: radical SAM family heme chaperone HemW [Chloroflexi bacterium]|nr:radical SAM family heme chaperone HemW [Chloroflexota bacterium]